MVCAKQTVKKFDNKSSSAHEIHVAWLYYGDIKIRNAFVYEYTPIDRRTDGHDL